MPASQVKNLGTVGSGVIKRKTPAQVASSEPSANAGQEKPDLAAQSKGVPAEPTLEKKPEANGQNGKVPETTPSSQE